MKRSLTIVGGAVVSLAAVAAYTVARVQGRATGDVEDFLASPRPHDAPVVVAGASIVRGRASVDFVEMLRHRRPDRVFVNAGVNGNVAWELLERLDDVMACRPSEVVILVGTNDVQATLSADAAAKVRRAKGLPEDPSLGFYARCMTDIVRRLRDQGCAVALCSLPPIGQDLLSPVNVRVAEANDVLAAVAAATEASYLGVHERLVDLLAAQGSTSGPGWTGSWLPGVRSLVEHFALGRSYDSIALAQGWLLSPDGVHMDSTGAGIIADVVEEWLVRQRTSL